MRLMHKGALRVQVLRGGPRRRRPPRRVRAALHRAVATQARASQLRFGASPLCTTKRAPQKVRIRHSPRCSGTTMSPKSREPGLPSAFLGTSASSHTIRAVRRPTSVSLVRTFMVARIQLAQLTYGWPRSPITASRTVAVPAPFAVTTLRLFGDPPPNLVALSPIVQTCSGVIRLSATTRLRVTLVGRTHTDLGAVFLRTGVLGICWALPFSCNTSPR
jgi:hypothetical protein